MPLQQHVGWCCAALAVLDPHAVLASGCLCDMALKFAAIPQVAAKQLQMLFRQTCHVMHLAVSSQGCLGAHGAHKGLPTCQTLPHTTVCTRVKHFGSTDYLISLLWTWCAGVYSRWPTRISCKWLLGSFVLIMMTYTISF